MKVVTAPETVDQQSLLLRAATGFTSRPSRDSNLLNSRALRARAFARTSASQRRTDLAKSCSSHRPYCAPQSLVCFSPCRGAPDTKSRLERSPERKASDRFFFKRASGASKGPQNPPLCGSFRGIQDSLDSEVVSFRKISSLEPSLPQFPRKMTQKPREMTIFPRALTQKTRELTTFSRAK